MYTSTSIWRPLSSKSRDYLLSIPNSELTSYLKRIEQRAPGAARFVLQQLREPGAMSAVERKRAADRERQAAIVARGQEIGHIRPVADPARRERSRNSLRFHLETYHATTFNCPWAGYHLILIERAEYAVHHGGWFAFAVPRGGGKSSISEGIVEWAILHGFKRWPLLLGATDDKAVTRLRNIKTELRKNPVLAADFPEVCQPVSALGRSARRAEGQLCCGVPTAMEWGQNQISLPTIPQDEWERWADESFTRHGFELPQRTGGSTITALGLLGDIRGLAVKTESLDSIRPDLAIPDDPQTRESAKSYPQSSNRAAIITGDVAYLNGPTTRMSVLMPGTVIVRGDMVDQMLDRNLNPEWHGERHKMVIAFPKRMDLWDAYAELRRECHRLDMSMDEPNAFYRDNRAEMDDGAQVSWEHRYPKDCQSALQHAMDLKIRDEASFAAEAQNEPLSTAQLDSIVCSVNEIIVKQHHTPRGVAPAYVEKVAAHIDVQQRLLYWSVMGASLKFEAAILDANTSPMQGRSYFSYAESLYTIQDAFPHERLEVQLYKAIQGTIAELATMPIQREDGAEIHVGLILVDCGWNDEVVIKACRESPFASMVIPAQGLSVRAKDTPLALRPIKPGETKGHNWLIKPKPDMPSVRYMQVDANSWKSQVHLAFRVETGPGSLSLWKDRPERHRLTAEHCNAEFPTRVEANKRTVDEWDMKPGRPDNHRFDNLYNCMAGLSYLGCMLPNAHDAPPSQRRRIPRKF